jgi:D-apionolactonase
VRCAFAGDVFEVEDQRNWSDASFKTYSRPLALPWPYTLEAGTTQRQSVTLSVEERSGAVPGTACAPSIPTQDDFATITLDLAEQTLETMPALGIAIAASEIDAALAHPELLAGIAPQQLTLSFDPVAGHGVAELERFAALQRRANIAAVLEYALPGIEEPRRELDALAARIQAVKLQIAGIIVSPSVHRQSNPPGSISPPCPALDDVYRAAREAFPELRIGGGMLSYFTELNRKRPPLALVDWVTHATCPIVHAADDRSVMQTLEAIPHITRSCRSLIGAQPYSIGPVSIGMRQNPYGSRVMPNPHRERIAMAGFDPRQTALFGGAWLAGYAAALEGARIDTLTLGALTGERGLADVSDGVTRYPIYAVARVLAAMSGSDRLPVAVAAAQRSAIACIAARDGQGRVRVVVANLTDRAHTVRLTLRGGTVSFHALISDEETDVMRSPARVELTRPVLLRPYAFLIGVAF